jgi:hypothetical protein
MGLAATFAPNSINLAQCVAFCAGHSLWVIAGQFSARAMISFPRDRALAVVRLASDGQASELPCVLCLHLGFLGHPFGFSTASTLLGAPLPLQLSVSD